MDFAWPLPPLVSGDWKTLAPGAATAVLARFAGAEVAAGQVPSAELVDYSRVRALRIFPEEQWFLLEAEATFPNDEAGLLTVLFGPERRMLGATWSPAELAELLWRPEWTSGAIAQAARYINLFVNYTRGDDDRFRIVQSEEDMGAAGINTAALEGKVRDLLRPMSVIEEGGRYKAQSAVLYAGVLYRTAFELDPSGAVIMTDDEAVAELGSSSETLRGPFRIRVVDDGSAEPASAETTSPGPASVQ